MAASRSQWYSWVHLMTLLTYTVSSVRLPHWPLSSHTALVASKKLKFLCFWFLFRLIRVFHSVASPCFWVNQAGVVFLQFALWLSHFTALKIHTLVQFTKGLTWPAPAAPASWPYPRRTSCITGRQRTSIIQRFYLDISPYPCFTSRFFLHIICFLIGCSLLEWHIDPIVPSYW